jgi:hypothetical protein
MIRRTKKIVSRIVQQTSNRLEHSKKNSHHAKKHKYERTS